MHLVVEFQDAEGRTYTAVLTTDHSGSRYGQPVLVVNGRDLGPGDLPGLCGEPLTVLFAVGSGPTRRYQSPDNPAVQGEYYLAERYEDGSRAGWNYYSHADLRYAGGPEYHTEDGKLDRVGRRLVFAEDGTETDAVGEDFRLVPSPAGDYLAEKLLNTDPGVWTEADQRTLTTLLAESQA